MSLFSMKISRHCARLAVIPLACAAAVPAFGQGNLSETVVTATRNSQPLSATLQHTTVITRDAIERSQATDLATLLQREAGLQRAQNGGIGTVGTVFLRGAPARQTLVLIDGVPQTRQDASGGVGLEHLMLDSIERVEIVRGNVSAIYGSGAIGGVIQIFTRAGSREPAVAITTEVGPRSTRKVAVQASGQVGATRLAAGLSDYRTDGFSAVDTAQFAGANPDRDAYDNQSWNLSLEHALTPQHDIGLRASRSRGDTSYDNPYGAATDRQTSQSRLQQASLYSDYRSGNWRSRLTVSSQHDDSATSDSGLFGSDDRFRTGATTLAWVNTLGLGGDWLGTAGLESQRQRVRTASTSAFVTPYKVQRTAEALFAGVEGPLASGQLQFNLRHDKLGPLSATSGFLGYSYPVSPRLRLIASTSTAFNAPPLGYLYAPGFGNPALQPERARSHEIGVQFDQGPHRLRATWFDTRVRNQIDYNPVTFAFANIGRTRNDGLELSYTGKVGSTDLRSSLTLQDPVDASTGKPLIRRSRTLLSLGATQRWGALILDADLSYGGKRDDRYSDPATFASVNTVLAGHSVLDLALAWRLTSAVELRARLDNAADRRYQTVYGYHQQPRSLYLGLRWQPLR